ncbi:hypothetical protein F5146DRAFT_1227810 [Armillaria mellea]|nr:hypothetical protein F5146DRAFT_1227810 [Armillaria mellea]
MRDISVHLNYSHISPTLDDKDEEMVQLLVDNCERWYSLEISHYCMEMPNLLGDVRGHIPNLTNLVLHRREPTGASPITVFEIAPKLRTVEIHGGFGVALGPGSPSLISYKDYRRSGPGESLDEYFTIFRSCRNLETFTKLHAYQGSLPSHAQSPPIILPQLRHFQGSHTDLIQSVTIPNLESFHLDVFGLRAFSDNLNALLNVRDLFIRSGCQSLSKLTLSNAVTIHILDIIPLVPALAILQFQFSRWQDGHRDAEGDIFRSLFQQMKDIDKLGMLSVVPNLLGFLSWSACAVTPAFYALMGSFLTWWPGSAKTLEKVEVRGAVPGDIWSSQQVSVFEGLLKEGMDISLNCFRPWDFSEGLNSYIITDD